MCNKKTILFGLIIGSSITMALAGEQKENEITKKREIMHKQLKGEKNVEQKISACKDGDEDCLIKEAAENKKLMKKQLKGTKSAED